MMDMQDGVAIQPGEEDLLGTGGAKTIWDPTWFAEQLLSVQSQQTAACQLAVECLKNKYGIDGSLLQIQGASPIRLQQYSMDNAEAVTMGAEEPILISDIPAWLCQIYEKSSGRTYKVTVANDLSTVRIEGPDDPAQADTTPITGDEIMGPPKPDGLGQTQAKGKSMLWPAVFIALALAVMGASKS